MGQNLDELDRAWREADEALAEGFGPSAEAVWDAARAAYLEALLHASLEETLAHAESIAARLEAAGGGGLEVRCMRYAVEDVREALACGNREALESAKWDCGTLLFQPHLDRL